MYTQRNRVLPGISPKLFQQLTKGNGDGNRTYWLIKRISTVLRSNSSKNGREEKPSFAGCIPASSYINLCQSPYNPGSHAWTSTYHYRLPLVLNDMTRPANLISPSQTIKRQFIRRVDGLIVDCRVQGRRLALGRHGDCSTAVPRIFQQTHSSSSFSFTSFSSNIQHRISTVSNVLCTSVDTQSFSSHDTRTRATTQSRTHKSTRSLPVFPMLPSVLSALSALAAPVSRLLSVTVVSCCRLSFFFPSCRRDTAPLT